MNVLFEISPTYTPFEFASLPQGYTWILSWGWIKVQSTSSFEVWETVAREHYLVAYNPQHPNLIDIVSLLEDD